MEQHWRALLIEGRLRMRHTGETITMSADATPAVERSHEFPEPGCSLAALQTRSQADFEIDFYERILHRDPNHLEVLLNLGELFSARQWHRRALPIDERLALLRPKHPVVQYNLACSYALAGRIDEALVALRSALLCGYRDFEYLYRDADLAAVRKTPEFLALVEAFELAMPDGQAASE